LVTSCNVEHGIRVCCWILLEVEWEENYCQTLVEDQSRCTIQQILYAYMPSSWTDKCIILSANKTAKLAHRKHDSNWET
jgi:hypothetical protein